jgi:hypothetical protein
MSTRPGVPFEILTRGIGRGREKREKARKKTRRSLKGFMHVSLTESEGLKKVFLLKDSGRWA